MSLASGTKLGPYEVLGPLGAGGMGEVYKAKDTRLERVVALKVLPEDFFEDEESIARFEREARMLASLNHPGNVMLTKSGAKLLDFGLAKVAAPLVRQSDLTSRPTELPKNLTQKGTILGTVQYMACLLYTSDAADEEDSVDL